MRVIDTRVVNLEDLELEHFVQGSHYESRCTRLGPALGAKSLGYSYDIVPPGKRACPFHSHRGEEEMFFVVRGTGTLRYGSETRPVRAGDVICCPTGGPETAHQIVNDSSEELAYLSVSTMSIGSNDLTQLTLGLDRDSGLELLAKDFDERDPAVKAMISRAIAACRATGKYIGICGQGPSDHPDFADWLADEGIVSISLNPDSVVESWKRLAMRRAVV